MLKPSLRKPTALFLLAGRIGSTSWMRAEAMKRLGYEVTTVQMLECIPRGIWAQRFHRRSGYIFLQREIVRFLRRSIQQQSFDFAWVDHGILLGPAAIGEIRKLAPTVVNYNVDDPTGRRDGWAWASYLAALSRYDLIVTVRQETAAELSTRGARKVIRVYFSYDELMHRPIAMDEAERVAWNSKVLFVGTWMERRDKFLVELIQRGVPVAIYGDHWRRAPLWNEIRPWHRGSAIYGSDYAKAVQCSKICLGLLSKGNRDLHTQRSLEIPAMGGLFCGERTQEHVELFAEGIEAEFWSSASECAQKCEFLLGNEERRKQMAMAGRARVLAHNLGHETMIARVLAAAAISNASGELN